MTLTNTLVSDIKKFMREARMSKTVLGLRALNNPHAVADWLTGASSPKLNTVDRMYAFMEKYRKENS